MDPTREPVEVLDYARKRQSWYSRPRRTRIAILTSIVVGLGIVFVLKERYDTSRHLRMSRVVLTRVSVGSNAPLTQACSLFRVNTGRHPASLSELITRPTDPAVAPNWRGPYLRGPAGLSDPWGRPYQYRVPSTRKKKAFDLWSLGPDGINGSADDILN